MKTRKAILRFYNHYFLRLAAMFHARVGEKGFLIILGLLIGTVSGLAAVGLRYLVANLHHAAWLLKAWPWNILLFFLPALGIFIALLIGRMLFRRGVYDRSLSTLIYRLSIQRGNMPWIKTFSHILTSGFTVGLGGSAGLEAPIVLTGAAIGSNGGALFRIDKKKKNLLIGCGAAAGIAAIFDSPVAGVLFVAEVMLPEFSVAALVPLLLASAVSAVISKMLSGEQLFLLVSTQWYMNALPFYLGAGVICALIGVYMIRCIYTGSEWLHGRFKNEWGRMAVGGLALCALIFILPMLFGEGYDYVNMLFSGRIDAIVNESPLAHILPSGPWTLIVFCLAAVLLKVIALLFTVEGGGDGGIFAPSMFTGAFVGFVFARLVNLSGVIELNEPNFVALGMCGVFAAVMKAPMTAVFLIAEVTGGYMLLIPLMIVSSISFFTSRYFEPYSIYTRVLAAKGMLFNEDKDHAILNRILVKTVIRPDTVTIHKNETFRHLAGVITSTNSDFFPVIDDTGKLAGMVYLDKIRYMLLNQDIYDVLLVYDLMEDPVGTLRPDDSLSTAISHLEIFNLANLPVTDANGHYLGHVSKDSIFSQYRNLVRQTPVF